MNIIEGCRYLYCCCAYNQLLHVDFMVTYRQMGFGLTDEILDERSVLDPNSILNYRAYFALQIFKTFLKCINKKEFC